ncbi:hypothetical protein F4779DRAFT_619432 [Xylariaceae sp. FL0662B]|nr:hypothetical protein F4779DRAFT_619432 [Xylariaceae sp. FL0662B]
MAPSGDTKGTGLRRNVLDAAIKSAFEYNEVPDSVEELIQYLKEEGIPEKFLEDEHTIFNIFIKYSKQYSSKSLINGYQGSKSLSPENRPVTPPHSNKSEPGLATEHDPGAYSPQEPRSSEELITMDEQSPDTFFLYVHSDLSDTDWAGFTAIKCLEKQNYITQSIASRLKRSSGKGTKHRLIWHAKGTGIDKKTRRSTFVVIPDERLEVDVAIGSEWWREEDEEQDDTLSNQPTQEQAPSIDGKVQPWLTTQDRHPAMTHGSEYTQDTLLLSLVDRMCTMHTDIAKQATNGIIALSTNSAMASRPELLHDLALPGNARPLIRQPQPPHRGGPT